MARRRVAGKGTKRAKKLSTDTAGLSSKEQERILDAHHPEIQACLDIDEIFAHLNQHHLLTNAEKQELQNPMYTANQKINKLLLWIPRKGPNALHDFITCLRKSADGTGHAELADKLEKDKRKGWQHKPERGLTAWLLLLYHKSAVLVRGLNIPDILVKYVAPEDRNFHHSITRIAHNPWVWVFLSISIAVCTIASIFLGKSVLVYWFNLDHSKTLPYTIPNFVGRTAEMEELNHLMDTTNQDIRIVSIVGSPGFGKSTLAIQVGHNLVQQGFVVAYVNMIEVLSVQALPEKVLDGAEIKTKNATTDRLLKWARDLSYPTVMIFDNCDDILHRQKNELQEITKKLLQSSSKLKILMTSRQRTMQLAQFRLFPLHELSREASCTLLQKVVKDLDQSICETITNLTGNVPLALQVIGSILSLPDPPTPVTLVHDLKDHLMATLSPEELPNDERVNISISLSYQYLSKQAQKISRYLANFPGSFDRKAACEILLYISGNKDHGCDKFMDVHLKVLVQRSLLEYNRRSNRYQFHRLIREFFIGVQKSIGENGVKEEKRFAISFQWYYSNILQSLAHQFSNHYAYTLHTLDTERHNIEKLLLNFKFIATTNHTVALSTATAVEFALSVKLLHCRFSPEELTDPILQTITYLKSKFSTFSRRIPPQDYMEVYINLIISLVHFESSTVGIEKALKRFEGQKSWIESLDLHIPGNRATVSYTNFYSILADYYAILGRQAAMRRCHEKILQKMKELSECHPGFCDYYHIGTAYYRLGNYKQSTHFLELFLKETYLDPFATAAVLTTLQNAYKSLNDVESANEATMKLVALLPELTTANYRILFKYEKTILSVIDLLVQIGQIDEAYVLKEKVLMAKKEILGHDLMFEAIDIVEFLFSNKKYLKTSEIGKLALKDLQQLSAKTEIAFTNSKLHLLKIIGTAEYYNGNSSESLEYLGQLVELVYENYTSATTENLAMARYACIYTTIQGQPMLTCVKMIATDIKNVILAWLKLSMQIPVGIMDWNIEKPTNKKQEETLRQDEARQSRHVPIYSKSLIPHPRDDDVYGLTVYHLSKVLWKFLFETFMSLADLLLAIFVVCDSILNALLDIVYVRYTVNILWILLKACIYILITYTTICCCCVLPVCVCCVFPVIACSDFFFAQH